MTERAGEGNRGGWRWPQHSPVPLIQHNWQSPHSHSQLALAKKNHTLHLCLQRQDYRQCMGRVRQKLKSLQNFCGTTMAVGIVGKAHSLPNASLPAAVYCRKLPDNSWLHLSPDKTTLGFLSNTSQQSWCFHLICFPFVFPLFSE